MRVSVVVLVLAVLAGCGGSDTPTAPETTPTTTATAASQLAGTSLEGESISIDDFRGRPVLLNVWSAW